MPDIFEIKGRIEGLKSINNITYAMQIVTISRLKRITAKLQKIKDSLTESQRILGSLLQESPAFSRSFFDVALDEAATPVYVLFFSNRGFCGSFNQDILSTFQRFSEPGAAYVCVGKKAGLVVKDTECRFFAPQKDLFTVEETEELYQLILSYMQARRPIYFIHFDFKSIVSQKVVSERFFPALPEAFEPFMSLGAPVYVEPSRPVAESNMETAYYKLRLLSAIQNSASSEFSQRFLLMKSAVDNVKTLSEELHLNLNKERQRMITQEISEIISTFKALQKVK